MQADNALRRHYERSLDVRNEANPQEQSLVSGRSYLVEISVRNGANSPAARLRTSALWERSYGAFSPEKAMEKRSQFGGVSSLKPDGYAKRSQFPRWPPSVPIPARIGFVSHNCVASVSSDSWLRSRAVPQAALQNPDRVWRTPAPPSVRSSIEAGTGSGCTRRRWRRARGVPWTA